MVGIWGVVLNDRVGSFVEKLGQAFSLLFVALLALSFWFLIAKESSLLEILLSWSFYSLILGATFQTGAFLLRPGNPPGAKPGVNSSHFCRVLAFLLLVLVIASGASFAYQFGLPASVSSSQSMAPLTARVFFTKTLAEPLNQTLVSFGIVANGSLPPYTYTVLWPGDEIQTNQIGTFQRTFNYSQSIPSAVLVTVRSADNKSINLTVGISELATSTFSSQKGNLSTIIFNAAGLPVGTHWSVSLNGTERMNASNSIIFPNLEYGTYNYSVNYNFGGNLDAVYNISPKNGTLMVSERQMSIKINFSTVPLQEIAVLAEQPRFLRSNGTDAISLEYQSNLPVNVTATVVISINDSKGKTVAITSASLILGAENTSRAFVVIPSLIQGNYSASVEVLYSNQVISNRTSFFFESS